MKTRFKLLVSMFTLVLCIGVMTFGAFAAKQFSTGVTGGTLDFTYDETHHIMSTISTSITGGKNDIGAAVKLDGTETDLQTNKITLSGIEFKDTATDGDQVVVVITITNDQDIEDGSELLVKFAAPSTRCTNMTFDYSYSVDNDSIDSELTSVILQPAQELTLTYTWTLVNAGENASASFIGINLVLERFYS